MIPTYEEVITELENLKCDQEFLSYYENAHDKMVAIFTINSCIYRLECMEESNDTYKSNFA